MSAKVLFRYKFHYWRRQVLRWLGRCPVCTTKVNYTVTGRAICPYCGR